MSLTASAPAASARRATSTEKVSAETGTPQPASAARAPAPAPPPRPRRGTGGPALAGDGADVEHVEARLDQRQPVGDRLLRRAAARPLEHRVDGDVDDPGRERLLPGRGSSAPGRSAGPCGPGTPAGPCLAIVSFFSPLPHLPPAARLSSPLFFTAQRVTSLDDLPAPIA